MSNRVEFETLKGKTITKIVGMIEHSGMVEFYTRCGRKYTMLHFQDCCEDVSIEDVCGDVEDLLDSEIVVAEEVKNDDDVMLAQAILEGNHYESATWTFYKLDTVNGGVTIRWLGTSNGYYSEEVSFIEEENYYA